MERSPPDSEALFPKISSSSSAQVSNFNEEQIILNARENSMTIDVENVGMCRCWVNKETDLMEKNEGLLTLETMKFKEELQLSGRECGELQGRISRLNSDHSASSERVKTIGEKYSFEELNKKTLRLVEKKGMEAIEKDDVILKLNEQINELKNQELEKLKLEEKLQSSQRECDKSKEEITRLIEDKKQLLQKTEEKDEMIFHLSKKIKELENQKLETENIAETYEAKIKSLNLMVVERNEEADELKQKNSMADQVVEDLSFKLLDADQNLEEYKKRFKVLNARVIKVEQDLADVLKVKVNHLPNQANHHMEEKKSVSAEQSSRENKRPLSGRRKRENDNHFKNQTRLKNDIAESSCENKNKRPLSRRRKRENGYHFENQISLKNDIAADDSPFTVVCALKCSTNETNSVPRRGKRAISIIKDHSTPVKMHSEDAGCSRKMEKSLECGAIVKYNDSGDEATKQEASLMISEPERKSIAHGSENNDNIPTGALKEKRRRELTLAGPESLVNDCIGDSKSLVAVNQPSDGIDVSTAATDSDDDSISSSRIEDILRIAN